MPKISWFGFVTAAPGHTLLGGEEYHHSARFETREQARAWTEGMIILNRGAGREVVEWGERCVELPCEITLAELPV